MITRIFLGLQAVMFIGYGLYCLVQPELLADGAGVMATSQTGTIELQAMYGGLQTAVGALCALGAAVALYRRYALVTLLFVIGGLAVVRVTLGLMNAEFSGYNVFAMTYETLTVLAVFWLLRREPLLVPAR